MIHNMRPAIVKRMRYLEKVDQEDRVDGTPRLKRLRQIPPETGRLLAVLAATAPEGMMLEIGTSAGYSTLWLVLACEVQQRSLVTYEFLPQKAVLAQETFCAAGVGNKVKLVAADARDHLQAYDEIAFCLLDAEKEIHEACYEMLVPKLVSGGLLVADNAINHRDILQPMLDKALADERVDGVIVPIGKGV